MTEKLKASDILQEAHDKGMQQTKGRYYNNERTKFCGLGVIRSKVGLCNRDLSVNELNELYTKYIALFKTKDPVANVMGSIIHWNDKEGLSFGEIAQRLREKYNL